MMKQFLSSFAIILSMIVMLTGCNKSGGKQVEDKTMQIVKASIDSLMNLEPDLKVTSLSVIKSQMPAVFAEELKTPLKSSGELLGMYIFAKAMGGKTEDKDKESDEIIETVTNISLPVKEAIKKYEAEIHPDYIFGLAKVVGVSDTTKTEKRVYIFEENNPSKLYDQQFIKSKKSSDIAILLAMAYADKEDFLNKDFKLESNEKIKNDPVLSFLINE